MRRRMSLQAARMLARALEERRDVPGLAKLLRASQGRFLESQEWFQLGTYLVGALDRVKGGLFTVESPRLPSTAVSRDELVAALYRRSS